MKKQKTSKIIIAYAVLSLMLLIASDMAVVRFSSYLEEVSKLHQYRGYLYVVLSAIILYFVMNNLEIKALNRITSLKSTNSLLKQEVNDLRLKVDFNEYANKKLENYAYIDELTMAYSRRKGLELLRGHMYLSAVLKSSILIAFIDIDNLKTINDKFGYVEGDLLLRSVAKILKDSISKKDIICRYGGDEFLVVLPEACMDNMKEIKARMEDALSKHNAHRAKSYAINISIGFTEYNMKNPKPLEELLQEADHEMHLSKKTKELTLVSNFK